MRDTSCVNNRRAVFCRADASISSSPNFSSCPANARPQTADPFAATDVSVFAGSNRDSKASLVSVPQVLRQGESDRRLHQFLPTLPSFRLWRSTLVLALDPNIPTCVHQKSRDIRRPAFVTKALAKMHDLRLKRNHQCRRPNKNMACNSMDVSKTIANMNIYRPKFVVLDIPK